MATGFQSSFIPKSTPTEEVFKKEKTSIFGVLMVAVFGLVIILSIGLFFYKGFLKSDIAELQSQLDTSLKNIDQKSISEMSQYSKKLGFIKALVLKHQVVSGFLSSLASSTVSTVSFSEFTYNNLTNNGLVVTMRGRANSYGGVALQESVFAKNKYWKSVSFSHLSLSDKGGVNFDVTVMVDPQIAIYTPTVADLPFTSDQITQDINKDLEGIDKISSDINNL